MKKFLVILCFLVFPLISFANDFEAVEDDLNGIEEWHFTFGLGINTSATYGGVSLHAVAKHADWLWD